MNVEFVARGYVLDDKIREYAEDKLGKLSKFLEAPVDVRLTLEQEKHRQIADLHIAHRFGVMQAREETVDMFGSVLQAVEKLEKQARRAKRKHQSKIRRADPPPWNGHEWPLSIVERASLDAGDQPRIIRSTHLQIKPMTIDEAALQLEGSKNDFFVFRDAVTDRVSVLYKRRDENYGLISPEF